MRRCVLDRDTSAGAKDLTHWRVLEFLAIARTLKEERSARQLTDVQDIPGEEQLPPEDWSEQVSVLARAHGAQEHDLRVRTDALRQQSCGPLERGDRGSRALRTESVALQVGHGNQRIGRNQSIRHGDDVDSISRVGGLRECASVFQLPAKVEAAQKAEDIAEGNTLLTEPPGESRAGARPSKDHGSRAMCGGW